MATKAPDVSGKGTSGSVPEPGIGAELIEAWLAHSRDLDPDQQDWMSTIMPHMSVESHSADGPHPSVTFRFTVQPQHCNGMNNLHGGCTATLFDFATTMPILFLSKPGFWEYLGVSRTLNTTYLRPIPCGTAVFIHADVLQIGKRMATTRGTMRAINPDGTEGAVLAVCEHGKACIDPPKM